MIHRDIKSSNLLLHNDLDPLNGAVLRRRLMISDFGTSVIVRYVNDRSGHTGTAEWVISVTVSCLVD